ncbi:MAG: response regulator [Candidatus Nitrohelix vancouverensis]|uniref:Response regulator n=1 Tax=Candidatus Nitrohelix vancouverensis TaxID=2705534 RepID=A0A7T0G2I8_9BACT|nr:MAG: response regulator [Candidatus Nitrohelix vancouverensis]
MNTAKKIRAVVADDEMHIRRMVVSVLKTMQCEIVGEASNGQEAIELFEKERPDILFMDINMPLKRGDDALVEIMQAHPNAFVIMLTSVSDVSTIQKCVDAGAVDYIRKDTPIPELKLMLKEAWDEFNKKR